MSATIGMSAPRCRVAVASAEHVRIGHRGGYLPVCHGKGGPLRHVEPEWAVLVPNGDSAHQQVKRPVRRAPVPASLTGPQSPAILGEEAEQRDVVVGFTLADVA